MALSFDKRLHTVGLDALSVEGVDLTNDGARVAAAYARRGAGPGVAVFRCEDDAPEAPLAAPRMGRGVAFTPDGRGLYWLADADDSGSIELRLADLGGGTSRTLAEYKRHPNTHGLARDRVGRSLAVLGNFVEVWDVPTGKVVRFRETHTPQARAQAAFNAEGSRLYVAGLTPGRIECLDVEADEVVGSWAAPGQYGVASLAVSRGEEYLVCSSEGMNGVAAYDLKGGGRVRGEVFHERAFTNRFVFVASSPVAAAPEVAVEATDLGTGAKVFGPEVPRGPASAAASAWDAPVVAFALHDRLCWIGMVED